MFELNGRASIHFLFHHHILKTLNVGGWNTPNGTSATINMYGATQMIGLQDAQIVCTHRDIE